MQDPHCRNSRWFSYILKIISCSTILFVILHLHTLISSISSTKVFLHARWHILFSFWIGWMSMLPSDDVSLQFLLFFSKVLCKLRRLDQKTAIYQKFGSKINYIIEIGWQLWESETSLAFSGQPMLPNLSIC